MLPTLCACAKLRRSARIVSAVYDEALAPIGVTVAQYSLLRMLERAGPCSLSEFGEATGHDRTTLNRTLGALEKQGLVESANGKDRRKRIVALTGKGRELAKRGMPHWREAQAKIDEALGEDRETLFALLDRVEELRA